jgi:hypothetical protein
MNDNSTDLVMQASAMEEDSTTIVTPPFEIDSEKYSSFTKLLRVSVLVLRFCHKIRKLACERGSITSSELKNVEEKWLLYAQRKHFACELNSLAKGKRNSLQQQLGLYIDDRGLLRCKGRLDNAGISESAKHPVLLPRKEHLTYLIIEKIHREVLHSGVSQTLAKTRHRYWIPRGRATVKSVIHKCNVCRRFDSGPYLRCRRCLLCLHLG